MSLLKPRQREAVYPLANLMVLCTNLSEHPDFFNLTLNQLNHNRLFNRIYKYPVVLDFFKRKMEQYLKEFTDNEFEVLLKDFGHYSVSMFTMKVICIEKNPVLAKFFKLAYRLNDEQFREFIRLVIQQYTKREYEAKLRKGYLNTKSDGYGFTISDSAIFPSKIREGEDEHDVDEEDIRAVLYTYATWEDYPSLKEYHELLKEAFSNGVDVYLNDDIIGKVFHVYKRLDEVMAKITYHDEHLNLNHSVLINNYVLIPHLGFETVKETYDPRGITIKQVKPNIYKFTMYDKLKNDKGVIC